MHFGAEFEPAAELGQKVTIPVAEHSLSYLVEVVQEHGLKAHTGELLGKELALHGLIFVFADLIGVLEVDLLDELPNEVLVEIGAEFVRQLYSKSKRAN